MGEQDELPLYVFDDARTRRTAPRPQHEREPLHLTPRVLVPAVREAVASRIEHPVMNPAVNAAPESHMRHISNFGFLRQVWVPPTEAAVAFDAWRARTPVVRAGHSRLSFGPNLTSPRPPMAVLGAEPLRAVSCRLHVPHWPHEVPVEMYLLPWNSVRTAIDLRPRGRGRPVLGLRTGAYFTAGHAVLDLLVEHLDSAY